MNIIMSICVVIRNNNQDTEINDFIRKVAAILSVTYLIELFKFMEMLEETAFVVNILYRIVQELKVFAFLFGVLIIGFGCAFFYIGQN